MNKNTNSASQAVNAQRTLMAKLRGNQHGTRAEEMTARAVPAKLHQDRKQL